MIQSLTLTLKMTTAQVVKKSVTINNNNSPIQDYIHLDDHTQPTFEMTSGFKPFTTTNLLYITSLNQTYTNHSPFPFPQGLTHAHPWAYDWKNYFLYKRSSQISMFVDHFFYTL